MKWNYYLDITAKIATILGLPFVAWSAWKAQKEVSAIRQSWQTQQQFQSQNINISVGAHSDIMEQSMSASQNDYRFQLSPSFQRDTTDEEDND